MSSEYFYVLLKIDGNIQIWSHKTKYSEYNTVEELIPCPIRNQQPSKLALQKVLNALSFQLEEDCNWGSVPIAMSLDFDNRRMILNGLGRRWRLPETTIARFAFPLLKHAGWQTWDIRMAPFEFKGLSHFSQYPSAIDYQNPPRLSQKGVIQSLVAQNPWEPYYSHDNLLISIRQNGEAKHYLAPNEGYFHMGYGLAQGPTLLDLLELQPDCSLLNETEVSSTLLIDVDQQWIAQGTETLQSYGSYPPYNPKSLQQLWPNWHITLNLQGYVGHLRNLGILNESKHLLLTAEKLADFMLGAEFSIHENTVDLPNDPNELKIMANANQTLCDWFESLLTNSLLRTKLIRLLDLIVTYDDISIWT